MADRQDESLTRAGYLAIIGTGIMPGIAAGTIAVMLPAISDAFQNGSNGIQIKSVATALGLGMLLGAPLGGMLADRIGRRPVLIASALIFGVAGCSIMLMSQLWQIIAARFIIGLVSGAMGVAMAAVVGDYFTGTRQSRWIGINAGAATLVVLLLNPVAGALSDLGWRWGFALYALALPILITIIIGVPRDLARTSAERATDRFLPPWNEIPGRALLLAVFMGTLSMGTSLYWPFRFREVGVESARDIAFYAVPNMFLLGSAALSYGYVRRFLSVTQVFLIGSIGSAIGLVVMGFAQTPALVMAGLAIEGLAVGMMTPNLTTFALLVSRPEARGRNVGLVKGALYGSPFLTQFALEPIAQHHGTAAALWTIAALAAALALAVVTGALGRVAPQPSPA